MDDLNKALNAEVNKLIKWEAETAVEESEVEAELKAALKTAEEKTKELQAIETILRRSHHE